MKIRFQAPLQGMWDEMQVNLVDHNIAAVREGETATFTGSPDDIDCFISKHYDGSGLVIVTEQASDTLEAEVLALGLLNPISGCDVDADDVAAYVEDIRALEQAPSLDGFKHWLNGALVF
jgi:hypothetical protein